MVFVKMESKQLEVSVDWWQVARAVRDTESREVTSQQKANCIHVNYTTAGLAG